MVDSAKSPVLECTAQIGGRTAQVWVYRDRIEFMPRIGPSLMGRAVLAAATEGNLDPGSGGSGESEMETLPIDSISSIAARRVGLHVRLSMVTRGSTIEMDLSHVKAARMQEVLRSLMSSERPPGR